MLVAAGLELGTWCDMKFFSLLPLCALLAIVAGSVNGDADFMSVRTGLAKDYSGKGGDPAEKYFREFPFHHPF